MGVSIFCVNWIESSSLSATDLYVIIIQRHVNIVELYVVIIEENRRLYFEQMKSIPCTAFRRDMEIVLWVVKTDMFWLDNPVHYNDSHISSMRQIVM